MFRKPNVYALVVLCILVCQSSSGSTVLAQEPSAPDIIADTSKVLADTQTMHFTLDVEGTTYVDPTETIQLIKAEGDLQRPSKVEVEFQVQLFGAGNISIKMIRIDGEGWTTDLLTGKWGPAPEEFSYDPSLLFDTKGGLGPVIDTLTDVRLDGDEKIDGRDAYRVLGVADKASIDFISAETMVGNSFQAELWIDKENSQLLRVILTEPIDNGKDEPATWTMNLGDYDDGDISIEPPV